MLFQHLYDALALKLEWNLFGFSKFFMVIPRPAPFNDARDKHWVNPKSLFFAINIYASEKFG